MKKYKPMIEPSNEALVAKKAYYKQKAGILLGKCRPKEFFNPRVPNPDRLSEEQVKRALLPKQNPERCMDYIKRDPWVIECVINPTEDMCLEAVKQEGLCLYFIEVQTEGICRAAVKNDPRAITLVYDQTEELCKIALKQNGLLLRDIAPENITRDLCMVAVKSNGCALEHVPDKFKDDEICEEAVRNLPLAIMYCPEETEKLRQIALAEDPTMSVYFDGLTTADLECYNMD